VLTRAFTARQARKLLAAGEAMPVEPAELAAFPAQHGLTKPIRARADAAGVPEAQAWWAGAGAGLSRSLPVAGLVERLGQELAAALKGLTRSDR
jgi:nitronate monooxygenase